MAGRALPFEEARPATGRALPAAQPFRLAARRPDRARPDARASASTAARSRGIRATPWPPRCSRAASAWSAAASSITGRAASSAPAARSRTRWSGSARAGAPSRTPARPIVPLEDGLVAQSQNRWPSLALRSAGGQRLARAAAAGRLLLQDLHVAGRLLDAGLRAADPPRGGPRRGARRRRSGSLREAPCALRRAGGRRRPGRARGGARGRRAAGRAWCWPTSRRASAAACWPSASRSPARRRSPGSSRRSPSSRACPRSRCCRAPRRSATTTTTSSRWSRRSPTGGAARASGCGRCGRRRSCWRPARSSGRWCSPATIGRG